MVTFSEEGAGLKVRLRLEVAAPPIPGEPPPLPPALPPKASCSNVSCPEVDPLTALETKTEPPFAPAAPFRPTPPAPLVAIAVMLTLPLADEPLLVPRLALPPVPPLKPAPCPCPPLPAVEIAVRSMASLVVLEPPAKAVELPPLPPKPIALLSTDPPFPP